MSGIEQFKVIHMVNGTNKPKITVSPASQEVRVKYAESDDKQCINKLVAAVLYNYECTGYSARGLIRLGEGAFVKFDNGQEFSV